MSVGEILKTKGGKVVTIRSDASVAEAVQRLRDEKIGALVVSSDARAVDGVISERDVVVGLADRALDLRDVKVKDLMTSRVATCSPGDSVEKIMVAMTERRARHFPVVDGGRLVGIVSIGDVVKNRLEELKLERNVLRDSYIAGR